MFSVRTDLALEAAVLSDKREALNGVQIDEYEKDCAKVTKVKITNADGEKQIGKKKGNYITIECDSLRDANDVYDDKIKDILNQLANTNHKETEKVESVQIDSIFEVEDFDFF